MIRPWKCDKQGDQNQYTGYNCPSRALEVLSVHKIVEMKRRYVKPADERSECCQHIIPNNDKKGTGIFFKRGTGQLFAFRARAVLSIWQISTVGIFLVR